MSQRKTTWTHRSVRLLAGDRDPVVAITDAARATVLTALDSGWTGPPFDPFTLADLLHVDVIPKHNVADARTVPVGRDRFRIEFNPARPRGRLRYSIAHEIAHTLFPDCAEQVRDRVARQEMSGNEWQLEALCNVAAAEFLMPVGSFPSLREEEVAIDHLLDLRREFEVSTEALLIRTAKLADHACAVFAASRISSGRLRLDYGVASDTWEEALVTGTLLPVNSVAAQCTAIGFTASGEERWPKWSGSYRIECVGLPPYPGSQDPRIAGILFTPSGEATGRQAHYVRGDATQPRSRPAVVAQVVNDATPNWGGRGFAWAVRNAWPHVQDSFRDWAAHRGLFLGEVHTTVAEPGIFVASMVGQRGYGPSPKPRIRYAALRGALSQAAKFASEHEATLHMPRIGCGEGRGDWSVIEELIRSECLHRGVDVTVYDLPGAPVPAPEQPSLSLSAD